jgi:hypothetical protein
LVGVAVHFRDNSSVQHNFRPLKVMAGETAGFDVSDSESTTVRHLYCGDKREKRNVGRY